MKTHTPTPWVAVGDSDGTTRVYHADMRDGIHFGDVCVAECAKPEDAEFIAQACSAHGRIEEERNELLYALKELVEVAGLRGDSDLPHPCDDPKLWTARMQDAWDCAAEAVAKAEGETAVLSEVA